MSEFPVRPDLDAIAARDERREPTMLDSPRRDLRELLAWVRHLEDALNTARNDLRDIADMSPNWMEPDAVANSEREMRRLAENAQRLAEAALFGGAR